MDADNKSNSSISIMAAVLSNMNKELPGSGGVVKRAPLDHLNDADLLMDDLLDGEGSEKKDESTEKKGGTNTSNETAGSSSCRDDSDVDIFVSASNKLIGYRYSVDELLDIAAAECCKSRPDFVTNELFKVSAKDTFLYDNFDTFLTTNKTNSFFATFDFFTNKLAADDPACTSGYERLQ